MTRKEIENIYHNIEIDIVRQNITGAMDSFMAPVKHAKNQDLTAKLDEIQMLYKQMLRFYHKEDLGDDFAFYYNKMQIDLLTLLDGLNINLLKENLTAPMNAMNYHYTELKVIKPQDMISSLKTTLNEMATFDMKTNLQNPAFVNLRQLYETINEQLFNYFLLKEDFKAEDEKEVLMVMEDDEIESFTKALLLSSLSLSVLTYFDVKKVGLLIKYSKGSKGQEKMRAMVGLLLVLLKYSERLPLYHDLFKDIQSTFGDETLHAEFRILVMQLLRTNETSSLSKKISQDLMKPLRNMSAKQQEKMTRKMLEDNARLDMNPEWLDAQKQMAGVMEKVGHLQSEGSDVYFGQFSPMKQYPFFNTISHWVQPFNTSDSNISFVLSEKSPLLDIIIANKYICSSDKYSILLTVQHVPSAQRDMMLRAQGVNPEDVQTVLDDMKQEMVDRFYLDSNQYIQDLYRFYTLSNKRKYFDPILSYFKTLLQSSTFRTLFSSEEDWIFFGDFLFNKKWYSDAWSLYLNIPEKNRTCYIYQHLGYCAILENQYEEAIVYLEKSELLSTTDSTWALERMAFAYTKLFKFEDSEKIYRKLLDKDEDNIKLLGSLSGVLMRQNKLEDALSLYFKLDYLDPHVKYQRQIAWILFLLGKLEESLKYFKKIETSGQIAANDFMNRGHLYLALDEPKKALESYTQAYQKIGDLSDFRNRMLADLSYLEAYKIDYAVMSRLIDRVWLGLTDIIAKESPNHKPLITA